MPLLLILLLTAACMPLPWPPFLGGEPADAPPPWVIAALTAATQAVPVLLNFLLSRKLIRDVTRLHDAKLGPDAHAAERLRIVRDYKRRRGWLTTLNLAAWVASVGLWGWGRAVWDHLTVAWNGRELLAPVAEFAVPLPLILGSVALWWLDHPAERRLHETSKAVKEGTEPAAFWTRRVFLTFQLRQLALIAGLPVALFVAQQSAARFAPEALNGRAAQLLVPLLSLAFFAGFPLLVRPILGLVPLPPGPTRESLEALCARLGVGVADLLVWPTHREMVNAMAIGIVPRVRYIVMTDELLERLTPDEVTAVAGHEAGHLRHRHLPAYAVLLMASVATAGLVANALDQWRILARWPMPDALRPWLGLPPLLVMGAYVLIVFGWLSRRCERQADVFGARAGSCANPDCRGHDAATVLVPRGRSVCRTGAESMAKALEAVARLNGTDPAAPRPGRLWHRLGHWLRAWQHGPMASRIAFLRRLATDPNLAPRADAAASRARWGLLAALVAVVLAVGFHVGWPALGEFFTHGSLPEPRFEAVQVGEIAAAEPGAEAMPN